MLVVLCLVCGAHPGLAQDVAFPLTLQRNHPLARGLVAWYPLLPPLAGGGRIWDLVGGNHGTLSGVASVGIDPTGRFPAALTFDGDTGAGSIPDATPLNFGTNPFTVCLFFRMPTFGLELAVYSLVYKAAFYEFTPGYSLELYAPDFTGVSPMFRISNGSDTTPNFVFASTLLLAGPTHHVCGTRSGQTASLYLNGRLDATVTNADIDDPVDNTLPLGVGGFVDLYLLPFPGQVSDLRLYNRALPATQIALLATCKHPDYCGTVVQDDILALNAPRRRNISITNY